MARAVDLGAGGDEPPQASGKLRVWGANRRRLPAKYGERTQTAADLAQARRRASAPPQELALARPPERGSLEVDGSSTNWTT